MFKFRKKQGNPEEIQSYIGEHAAFSGNFSHTGVVRINGRFSGTVAISGVLIIGEKGVLDADIHATRVFVKGTVRGDIIADHHITITAGGRVTGNIQSPTLTLEAGAEFNGACDSCRLPAGKPYASPELTSPRSTPPPTTATRSA